MFLNKKKSINIFQIPTSKRVFTCIAYAMASNDSKIAYQKFHEEISQEKKCKK